MQVIFSILEVEKISPLPFTGPGLPACLQRSPTQPSQLSAINVPLPSSSFVHEHCCSQGFPGCASILDVPSTRTRAVTPATSVRTRYHMLSPFRLVKHGKVTGPSIPMSLATRRRNAG